VYIKLSEDTPEHNALRNAGNNHFHAIREAAPQPRIPKETISKTALSRIPLFRQRPRRSARWQLLSSRALLSLV